MRVRNVLFVTAGVLGAATGGAVIVNALDDPGSDVTPVELTGLNTPNDASGTATPAAPVGEPQTSVGGGGVAVEEVDGLEQLVGTLRSGEDPEDWYVSGVEVDFGPDGWISTAPAFEDYDADGTAEVLIEELRGLEGQEVTLGIRYEVDDSNDNGNGNGNGNDNDNDNDNDRDDADAFTIEGLAYRDATGGPAPWQSTPEGEEATRDQVAAAAVAAVGDGARVGDVDRENEDGWLGWDVEVYAADGREYQVYVDLAGTVVDVRLDD